MSDFGRFFLVTICILTCAWYLPTAARNLLQKMRSLLREHSSWGMDDSYAVWPLSAYTDDDGEAVVEPDPDLINAILAKSRAAKDEIHRRELEETVAELRADEFMLLKDIVIKTAGTCDVIASEVWAMAALELGSVQALQTLEEMGVKWPRDPEVIAPLIRRHIRDDNPVFAELLFKGIVQAFSKANRLPSLNVWIFEQLNEMRSAVDAFELIVELDLLTSDPGLLERFLSERGFELDGKTLEKILSIKPALVEFRVDGKNTLLAQAYIDGRLARVQLLLEFGASVSAKLESTEVSYAPVKDGVDFFICNLRPWLPKKAEGLTVAAAIKKYGPQELQEYLSKMTNRRTLWDS